MLGFSQGTIASFALRLESPERYAWCVGVHGYLAASYEGRTPNGIEDKPVFVGTGTADRIIPAERSERAAARLGELRADVTFRTYDVGHGVGPEELDDVVDWVERNGPRERQDRFATAGAIDRLRSNEPALDGDHRQT